MTEELQITALFISIVWIIILLARVRRPKVEYTDAVQKTIRETQEFVNSDHKTQVKLEEMKLREKTNDRRATKT